MIDPMCFDEASLDRWCAAHGGLSAVRYLSTRTESDRRAAFEESKVATAFATKLQRVDAILGSDVIAQDSSLTGVVDSVTWFRVVNDYANEDHQNIYTKGAIGCTLTHVSEIRNAARSTGCTLVLESDVRGIDEQAWRLVLADVPVLPMDVDMVWFNCLAVEASGAGKAAARQSPLVNMAAGPFVGMGAVLYTPQGAEKLARKLEKTDPIVSHQIDAMMGAVFARFPGEINAVRTNPNVLKLSPSSLMSTSIQTTDIKPFLPDSNGFYIAFGALFLGLVFSTSFLGLKLRRRRSIVKS